ncbi:hypothetical protein HHI36_024026 [Cryptolaemus montrouzieri]|uniref:Uncharacterized protein n=1 Tax=Cryptolaemus montrouzieri TaxID=559131 RepID=A0ABD2P459_9CUCU
MSSLIMNYINSLYSLKVNETRLKENINTFKDFTEKLFKAMNGIITEDVVTDHINIYIQLISELSEEVDDITAYIFFALRNIIQPKIISPRELRDELLKVKL